MTCSQQLINQGKPSPRTCQDCGLGPCKNVVPAPVKSVMPERIVVNGAPGCLGVVPHRYLAIGVAYENQQVHLHLNTMTEYVRKDVMDAALKEFGDLSIRHAHAALYRLPQEHDLLVEVIDCLRLTTLLLITTCKGLTGMELERANARIEAMHNLILKADNLAFGGEKVANNLPETPINKEV